MLPRKPRRGHREVSVKLMEVEAVQGADMTETLCGSGTVDTVPNRTHTCSCTHLNFAVSVT